MTTKRSAVLKFIYLILVFMLAATGIYSRSNKELVNAEQAISEQEQIIAANNLIIKELEGDLKVLEESNNSKKKRNKKIE